MNTAYTQPLNGEDTAAIATALSNQSGGAAARTACLKMVFQIAANAPQLGVSEADIFEALSSGYDAKGASALCEALSWETRLLGPWGALFLQAAGIIQVIGWLKSSYSWFSAKISSLEQIFLGMMGGVSGSAIAGLGGAVLSPLAAISSLFGVGQKHDRTGIRRDTNAVVSGLMLMATSEAPLLAAIVSTLGVESGSGAQQGMGHGASYTGMGSGKRGGGGAMPVNYNPNTPASPTPATTPTTPGAQTPTEQGAGATPNTPAVTPTTPAPMQAATTPAPAPTTPSPITTDRQRRRQDYRGAGINSRRELVNRSSVAQ